MRYAITFEGTVGGSFLSNQDLYRASGWDLAPLSDALTAVTDLLDGREQTRIAVDISSMPRKCLATVVEWLTRIKDHPIEVQFIYCPGDFTTSATAARRNEDLRAEPVSEFFSGALRAPSIPIGLVVGLGLEQHRALGLIELLEPARTWLFMGQTGDERFLSATSAIHEPLLQGTGDALLGYDIRSLSSTYSALESLAFSTGLKYRLLMAPSGPKIFALACLLVASSRDHARPAVWRVGGIGPSQAYDVEEAGDVVASVVEFGRG